MNASNLLLLVIENIKPIISEKLIIILRDNFVKINEKE